MRRAQKIAKSLFIFFTSLQMTFPWNILRLCNTSPLLVVVKLPSFCWFITFPGRIPNSLFSAENINFYLSSLADLIDSFNETLERFEAELLLKDSNLNAETERAKASQLFNNKDIDSLTMKLSFAHEYLHLGHFCPGRRGGDEFITSK